eukprot:31125-Pelagococcus_subviridis.AAC.14
MISFGFLLSPAAAERSQTTCVPSLDDRPQKSMIVRSTEGFGRKICSMMSCERYLSTLSSGSEYILLHR